MAEARDGLPFPAPAYFPAAKAAEQPIVFPCATVEDRHGSRHAAALVASGGIRGTTICCVTCIWNVTHFTLHQGRTTHTGTNAHWSERRNRAGGLGQTGVVLGTRRHWLQQKPIIEEISRSYARVTQSRYAESTWPKGWDLFALGRTWSTMAQKEIGYPFFPLASITCSTSDARSVKCAASRSNSSRFFGSVAKFRISSHSAASLRSFSN